MPEMSEYCTVDTAFNTLDKNSYLHGAYNLVRKNYLLKSSNTFEYTLHTCKLYKLFGFKLP